MATSIPAVTSIGAMEKALTARLQGIPKADIKSVAGVIDKLTAHGLVPDDVFPIGIIINNPDGVEVRGTLGAAEIKKIVDMIAATNPKAVTIFPRGIVIQDKFRVHMQLHKGGR